MAKTKATHAVVEVVVKTKQPWRPFPVDMLRYDSCVPANEQQAHVIEATREHYGSMLKAVNWSGHVVLRRFYLVGGDRSPTFGRWESFGWEVVKVYLPGEAHDPYDWERP